MNSKKILITLSEAPFGEKFIVENFRTALGVTAGYREHRVDLLFTGDAVFFVKMQDYDTLIKKFLNSFKLLGSNLYLDMKALQDRNINSSDVPEPFIVATRDEILDFYRYSSLNINL